MRSVLRTTVLLLIVLVVGIITLDKKHYNDLLDTARELGINTLNYQNRIIVTKKEIKELSEIVDDHIAKQKALAENPTSVPILMYHFFTESGVIGPDLNWMDIDVFESHLQMFKENGITPITLDQYDMWFQNQGTIPQKSVLITIDDGQPGTYELAAPLLEKYGFSAVSFEITSMWDNYDSKKNIGSIELASHTNDMHRDFCEGIERAGMMQCIDKKDGIEDLVASLEILDSEPIMFCYPFGGTSGEAYSIVQDTGFKYATTVEPGISTKEDDPLLLPRVRVNSDTSAETLKELLGF